MKLIGRYISLLQGRQPLREFLLPEGIAVPEGTGIPGRGPSSPSSYAEECFSWLSSAGEPDSGMGRVIILCSLNRLLVDGGLNSILYSESFIASLDSAPDSGRAGLIPGFVARTPLFPAAREPYGPLPDAEEILSVLSGFLKGCPIAGRAFLYGSFAKGTATEESDIDFAVLFREDTSAAQKGRALSEAREAVYSAFLRPVDLRELLFGDPGYLAGRIGEFKEAASHGRN